MPKKQQGPVTSMPPNSAPPKKNNGPSLRGGDHFFHHGPNYQPIKEAPHHRPEIRQANRTETKMAMLKKHPFFAKAPHATTENPRLVDVMLLLSIGSMSVSSAP